MKTKQNKRRNKNKMRHRAGRFVYRTRMRIKTIYHDRRHFCCFLRLEQNKGYERFHAKFKKIETLKKLRN